jgi:hypothetical protein
MVKYPRQEQQCARGRELEKGPAHLWSVPDQKEIASGLGRATALISPLQPQHRDSYGERERPGAKRSTFAHNHRG